MIDTREMRKITEARLVDAYFKLMAVRLVYPVLV